MTKEEKKQYNKEYRQANKDKISAKKKQYREANKDKISAKLKEYREANKDKTKEYNKEYRQANKDKISAKTKEYHIANKDKIKNWRKQNAAKIKEYQIANKDKRLNYRLKRQENPIYRLQQRLRLTLYRAIINSGYADDSLSAIRLGCSYDIFKLHIEEQFPRGMNWDNKHLWQFDHIKPFSSVTTEDETLKLGHYTNIQPLWAEDNQEKHRNSDWVKCPIKYAK